MFGSRKGSSSTELSAVDRDGARPATLEPSVGGLARLSVTRPAMESLPAHSEEELMITRDQSLPPVSFMSLVRLEGL